MYLFFIKSVSASCPVCVITVGGGLLLAKKLGIDDLLVAIWISGLNTAMAFYLVKLIKNKLFNNPYIMSLIFFTLTIIYLSVTNQLNHIGNQIAGIDKVFLGMTIGLITFYISQMIDYGIRDKQTRKPRIPYQKVIIPISCLILITFLCKFLLKI